MVDVDEAGHVFLWHHESKQEAVCWFNTLDKHRRNGDAQNICNVSSEALLLHMCQFINAAFYVKFDVPASIFCKSKHGINNKLTGKNIDNN